MFSGHWLIADMDGTLTPTPTRAGGRYFSFTESIEHCAHGCGSATTATRAYRSCLPALRLFIQRGGSLCVVSTAGRRLWRQMYTDLAPALYGEPEPREDQPGHGTTATADSAVPPGALLLCGFTGAALFRSRDGHAVSEAMRHRAPTSFSSPSARPLPPMSVGLEEWEAYRRTAGTLTAAHGQHVDPHLGRTTLDADVRDAAVREGRRAVIRFFEHASFVSEHNLDKARAYFESCLSTKYHTAYTDMLSQCLDEVRAAQPGVLEAMANGTRPCAPICFASLHVFDERALTTHGTYLVETQDALVDAQAVNVKELEGPCTDPTEAQTMPVAQVVVMGIPMRYCSAIFPDEAERGDDGKGEASAAHVQSRTDAWQCCSACAAKGRHARSSLTQLGLEIKSQPNSVCIHRRGIDKETCVRWLEAHAHELGPSRQFSRDRALSFGDVPASVDRPLWQFPPMQFISLSPLAHSGMDPAREPVPSTGFYEVGGEEEGTACFLDALIHACESAASGADHQEPSWFTEERVRACAHAAQKEVASWNTV